MRNIATQLVLSILASTATSHSLRGIQTKRELSNNLNTTDTTGQSPYLIPYTGDCALGQGFDLVKGCQSTAINPQSIQSSTSNINGDSTTYTQTLRTTDDVSTMMSSVTSAEGSYSPDTFSVKASTTVSYLTGSDVSTNTLTFYLGETQIMKKDEITNVNQLQLSDDAFSTFKSNPQHFVDLYGQHFISYINYGATFAGSLSLWEQKSASTESLSVFVSIDANDLFFSTSASESFSQSYNEVKTALSSQMTATYTGHEQVLEYNVTDPQDLGDAYTQWANGVTADSTPPITMLYVDYIQVPQIASYIANLTGTEYSNYMSLFSPPRIDSDTTASINNEAIQTSNLVTALKQAQSYNCYESSTSAGFKQGVTSQLTTANNHLNYIENQMTEADILQVQQQGPTGPFYQAAAMQTNYKNLVQQYPGCIPVCPTTTQWTAPKEDGNCGSSPPNEFKCAGTNQPINGLAFSHECTENYAYQEATQVECSETTSLHATFYTGKLVTLPMVSNSPCDSEYSTQMCPEGYYATSVNFIHPCNENEAYERDYQLVCSELNTAVGYKLAVPVESDWISKQDCTVPNTYQCPDGSVMVGLDFTHPCHEDGTYQETFRVHCAEVSGYDFYCPASS